MINFDAVDFGERRSEEVISFFWRSVYIHQMNQPTEANEEQEGNSPTNKS